MHFSLRLTLLKKLLRSLSVAAAFCLFTWACISNPPSDLKVACEQSIASADQLVVTTAGMAFPNQTFLIQGVQKDNFAREFGRVIAVDYEGFLWSVRIATARTGGSVDVVRNGLCEESFVFGTSRGTRVDDAINRTMEKLRLLAAEGEPVPDGSGPDCSCVERQGLFFWFGVPWEYEYVLRP
jgi:hypothetical protein